MKNNLSENENKVLEHLKKNTLTKLQAVVDMNILHVGDIIHRLRRYGYHIDMTYKSNGKKRYGVYKML
jgi:N-acetyl-anhydromuramyl-L-alanine amidase AmpD